jgi:2-keto-4-pentenoate hydratase/2-oxohepta-3-ene-1,7-dioic acid hydratase in catechol pathway
MRLITFRHNDGIDRLGALVENDTAIVDLHAARAEPAFASMLDLIEAGDDALDGARTIVAAPPAGSVIDATEASLQTPLPRPPQIRDCLCFEEHLKQAFTVLRKNRAAAEPDPVAALKEFEAKGLFAIPEVWYQLPIYYKANRLAVIGTGEDVLWPDYAEVLDYELEFGFFIGKGGKNIAKKNARDHIFGYSIFNDISARDAQAIEMPGGLGPGKGKDFDAGNVIGPCIVTADELDPYDCTMIARINGEEWSRGLPVPSTGPSKT